MLAFSTMLWRAHKAPESQLAVAEEHLGTQPDDGCQEASPEFHRIGVPGPSFHGGLNGNCVIPSLKQSALLGGLKHTTLVVQAGDADLMEPEGQEVEQE